MQKKLLLGLLSFLIAIAQAQESPDSETSESSSTDEWAGQPVMTPEHVNDMLGKRLQNAPKIGEPAPPFLLADAITGTPVSLSDLHTDKPTVLFFASYSCITAQEGAPDIAKLSERFHSIANFVLVYIQEAHPTNGFLPPYRGDPFVIDAPAEFAERTTAAIRFAREQNFRFRILVDTMDDATAVRWGAWPLRVFVIGQSGRVLYAGKQGPWFFLPTSTFNPHLDGVPISIGEIPGYSRESLADFLTDLETIADGR